MRTCNVDDNGNDNDDDDDDDFGKEDDGDHNGIHPKYLRNEYL